MFDSAPPNPTNLADQLPAQVYYHLIHTLCNSLPSPLTDSPEDLARRNHAAIARIAALAPANAVEAEAAAQYVAASEQWKECLRLAQLPERSFLVAMQCRAQANSMMRQANGSLRLLLRMQAARQKLEKDSEARDRAAWTEHCAIALMAEALSQQPEPQPAPPATAERPSPPPASKPQPQPDPAQEPRRPLLPSERAALIRLLRAFHAPPDGNDFVQSLITALIPPPTTDSTPSLAAMAFT